MIITEKRISISLTKEDVKELKELAEKFGESYTSVVRRALILLYHKTFHDQK